MSYELCTAGRGQNGDGDRRHQRVALVLQGGGAIGSYQVGVYRALDELGLRPDWVAGTSIGAVTAAIIAGNPPSQRVRRLEEFWRSISPPLWWPWGGAREVHNSVSTMRTALRGTLLSPNRPMSPWLAPKGTKAALSYCDPGDLRAALEHFVDFDCINAGETRLSLSAVNVRNGLLRHFDSAHETIGLEHVLAGMALAPALPAVEIDGELYWHGGVVSNTPLNAVLDTKPRADTFCVMVDLYGSEGPSPSTMDGVMTRLEDIGSASRTDASLARFKEKHDMRRAIAALIDELPAETRDRPEVREMAQLGCTTTMTIARLTYRPAHVGMLSRELDYSRLSVEEHMQAGYQDTIAGCSGLDRLAAPSDLDLPLPAGAVIHDLGSG
jgi:NTE family protein